MRIAIIGAGNLGSAAGRGWAAAGHDVTFGVRDDGGNVKGGVPDGAHTAPIVDAARAADVVLLAVPAAAAAGVLTAVGDALDGKVLIDATNTVGSGIRVVPTEHGESQAERIQALVPRARVVKSLNQVGANIVANPTFDARPVMFVAGDDAEAKRTVLALIAELGLDARDAGALYRSRELEYLAMLWISLSANPASGLGREFAFALMHR